MRGVWDGSAAREQRGSSGEPMGPPPPRTPTTDDGAGRGIGMEPGSPPPRTPTTGDGAGRGIGMEPGSQLLDGVVAPLRQHGTEAADAAATVDAAAATAVAVELPRKMSAGATMECGMEAEAVAVIVDRDTLYAIRRTAVAGRGAYAGRDLAAGTTLIREAPLRASSVAELVQLAVTNHALHDLCGDDDLNRVAQNHFVHEDGVLLFRRVSMLNHSCRPNASICFLENGEAEVNLARDVAGGEELCICYSSVVLFSSLPERQSELLSRWGFACGCNRCAGRLDEEESSMWRQLEHAASAVQHAKPRGPNVDPNISVKQREALSLIEARLPLLRERERFLFDAAYFA